MEEIKYWIIKEDIETFTKKNNFKLIKLTNKNKEEIIKQIKYINKTPQTKIKDYYNRKEPKKFIETNFGKILDQLMELPKTKKREKSILDFKQDGKPDFFMYDRTNYFFVEYKTLTDTLRYNQIKWFYRYNKKLPLIVIHSLEKTTIKYYHNHSREKTKKN